MMLKRRDNGKIDEVLSADMSDDFGPEEITSSSEEILKLKLLHEQLKESLDTNSKRRKKRKVQPDFVNTSDTLINDDDRPLEISVIESMKASMDVIEELKPIAKSKARKSKSSILIT